MKQLINNRYLKGFIFNSFQDLSYFLSNQVAENIKFLSDTDGENYYCYVCHNSLTRDKIFALAFRSDESEANLNFLFWDEHSTIVLDTGSEIFLLDDTLRIKAAIGITTPLIGIHIINKEKLLILEEAFMRIIDYNGQVLRSELFDLILEFNVINNVLFIKTNENAKTFKLI